MTRTARGRGRTLTTLRRPLILLTIALLARSRDARAQRDTLDLLERSARAYRTATTIRATFEQALTSAGSSEPRMARGEFFQQGPRHFALRFTQPDGDAIVADAEAVWLYLPSTAKGQVMKMPREAGTGLDFFTQLLTSTRRAYAVTPRADTVLDARVTRVYQLVSGKADAPFVRATLWIGRDDARLWQLETVEHSGIVRRLRFLRIRFNTTLPKGVLAFVPPAGVKVIDQAALMGGKP